MTPTENGNDFFAGLYNEADGPDEIRQAVREEMKNGADFIKIMGTGAVMNPGGEPGQPIYSLEELKAVVEAAKFKDTYAVSYTHLLTAEDLKTLAGQFKAEYKEKIGADFPSDAKEQLMGAVKAVFRSWDNPRANVYRRDNDIPYSWGTAVNVQMMAFGNMGDDCGTCLLYTSFHISCDKIRTRHHIQKVIIYLFQTIREKFII